MLSKLSFIIQSRATSCIKIKHKKVVFLKKIFSYFSLSGEYGGWQEALDAGDPEAVWVTAQPLKIPMHNFYEFIWFLKTGGPRLVRFEFILYGIPELDLFYMVQCERLSMLVFPGRKRMFNWEEARLTKIIRKTFSAFFWEISLILFLCFSVANDHRKGAVQGGPEDPGRGIPAPHAVRHEIKQNKNNKFHFYRVLNAVT